MNAIHTREQCLRMSRGRSSGWLWQRHSPRPLFVAVASTAGGQWGRGGYTSTGQARNKDTRNYVQERNEDTGVVCKHSTRARWYTKMTREVSNYAAFLNSCVVVMPALFLMLRYIVITNIF